MNPNDPNVAMVEAVVARLGALRERMVFVGGCAAGLLITDTALPAIRATGDVDVVVEAATLAAYHRLEKELAAAGFARDTREGAPICRWRLGAAALDLLPVDKKILGFGNRWYPLAVRTARAAARSGNPPDPHAAPQEAAAPTHFRNHRPQPTRGPSPSPTV
jgi:hypothetical protein